MDPDIALAISLLDLTSLNASDTSHDISQLCHKAKAHQVAAVCVYPEFVGFAREMLNNTDVSVATVVNFPHGDGSLDQLVEATETALAFGAHEIDLVLPYRQLMQGDLDFCREMLGAVKQASHNFALLKVIIESGELKSPKLINQACELCLQSDVDFIKTSTGKVKENATLEAAGLILKAIRQSGKACGFKASGGIRTADQAFSYIQLARSIMGEDWVTPRNMRFGASSLLDSLLGQTSVGSGY